MADNSSDPVEAGCEETQFKYGAADFTSSENSESNLGDSDPSSGSDMNKSTTSTNTNYNFTARTGVVLSSPQLANNPFAVKTTTATKSLADSTDNKEGRPIVAPATFTPNRFPVDQDVNKENCSSSSFKLKPAVLANPFAKCDSLSERRNKERCNDCQEVSTSKECEWHSDDSVHETSEEAALSNSASSSSSATAAVQANFAASALQHNISSSFASLPAVASNSNAQHSPQLLGQPTESNHSPGNGATTPLCSHQMPAGGTGTRNTFSNPLVAAANINFVFGQKMNERVRSSSTPSSNGTSLPSFGHSVTTPEGDGGGEEKLANGEPAKPSSKSLHESAQEYESRKVKRTYEEVLVVTGEEEESNVLQVNCKLFAFDKSNSSWIERGRGLLRLNDKEEPQGEGGALQSRLVMRTQGSLRVVLNTNVWAGMTIERPSPKSVRITAVDGEGVKVFLIMASLKDSEQLHNALNWRVKTLKVSEEQQQRFSVASGSMTSANELMQCGASGSTVGTVGPSDDLLHCQPSTTTSDDSSSSPKRRRVTAPDDDDDDQLDDSCESSEFGTNIQDTSIDSTSRNKNNAFEADSGNLSSSSL